MPSDIGGPPVSRKQSTAAPAADVLWHLQLP